MTQLTVAVPKDLQPNVSFQVTYTTQTDQVLTLFSVLRPASEAPCPASFAATRARTSRRPTSWALARSRSSAAR